MTHCPFKKQWPLVAHFYCLSSYQEWWLARQLLDVNGHLRGCYRFLGWFYGLTISWLLHHPMASSLSTVSHRMTASFRSIVYGIPHLRFFDDSIWKKVLVAAFWRSQGSVALSLQSSKTWLNHQVGFHPYLRNLRGISETRCPFSQCLLLNSCEGWVGRLGGLQMRPFVAKLRVASCLSCYCWCCSNSYPTYAYRCYHLHSIEVLCCSCRPGLRSLPALLNTLTCYYCRPFI